jgi:CHAT domain-containing protein/tetratricopeptide (TPR) repeat protein
LLTKNVNAILPTPCNLDQQIFNKAVFMLDKGNYDEALKIFETVYSEKSSHFISDSVLIANVLANIGSINYQLKLYDKAIEYYLRAEGIYTKIGEKELKKLASIQVNLAICYLKNGDMGKSLLHYENSDRIFQKLNMKNTPEYELLMNNFAAFYVENSNYDKALEYNRKAFQISTKYLKNYIKWMSRGYIFYRKHDYQESIKCYNTALKVMERDHGLNYFGKEQIFIHLGLVYLGSNQFDKSLNYFDQARQYILKNSGKANASYSLCLNRIGQVYQKRLQSTNNLNQFVDKKKKDLLTALQYYQEALCAVTPGYTKLDILENPKIENTIDKTQFLATLKNKAEALCDVSELEERNGNINNCNKYLSCALEVYQLSNTLIQIIRTGFVNQESRLFLAENEHAFYLGAIDAAVKLYELTHEKKYFEQAFEFSERSRSTDFLTMVRNMQAKQFGGIPDSLFQKETELKSEIAAYKNFIFDESNKSDKDLQKIDLWKTKIFTLEQSYANLISLFEKQYPKYYSFKYKNPVISVNEIHQKLKSREAFIEYVIREPDKNKRGEIIIFLITKDKFKIYKKELNSDYQQSVNSVLKFLRNGSVLSTCKNDYKRYATSAYSLYNLLIYPFASQVKGYRLVVVPDGKLAYLPYDAFISEAPDTARMDFKNLKYLIYDHSISYSYSATLLYNYLNSEKKANKLLGAFVPKYNPEDDLLAERLQPLTGAKMEVDEISRLIKSNIFDDNKATKLNFIREAQDYDILHLAMHTIINDSLPMFSKLLFTPEIRKFDSALNTYEIYNMNFKCRLAVLSACNSGSGQLAKGEGVMSLSRAFLYAGCPSILMTLWSVEDESSANLMIDFYKYLLNGYTKDEALRKAKLKYIQTADPLHAHPYYWLGYVSIGDQNSMYHTKTVYFIFVVIFILVVILSEKIYSFIRRK